MADILIKGLEGLKIPKEKRLVLVIEPDGEVWFPFEYKISRTFPASASGAKTTTAIELPPHVDLVERDWHIGEPSKYEQGWFLTKVMVRDCDGTFFPEYEACFKYEKWVDRRHQQPVVAYLKIEPI